MVTTPQIDLPMDEIAAFCRKRKITEFALFGESEVDRISSKRALKES